MPSQSWSSDTLDRKKYASFLTTLINSGSGPKVINLNASWGTGKTFFLENWYAQLIDAESQLIVYFNAWESDFSSDPLLAMLGAINEELMRYDIDQQTIQEIQSITSKAGQFLKQVSPVIAKALVKKCTGIDADELGSSTQESPSDQELENFVGEAAKGLLALQSNKKQSMKDFKVGLSTLVGKLIDQGHSGPLVILVDELDRCRPTYAIELLENIKHLFSVPEVTFVVATDSTQLQHTVKALYGEGFDGSEYLRRFFDAEFKIPQPDLVAFSNFLFRDEACFEKLKSGELCDPEYSEHDLVKAKVLFSQCAKAFDLSLRSQTQAVDKIQTILATHTAEWKSYWLIPLVIMNMKYPDTFGRSVIQARSGKGVGIILEQPLPDSVRTKFLEQDENYNRVANDYSISEILTQFFRALSESCSENLDISTIDSRRDDLYGYADRLIDPDRRRSRLLNALDYVDSVEMASYLHI